MANDRGIKALVVRVAKAHEEEHKDATGAVDKVGLTEFVLDYLEQEDPELSETLEREGARFLVWEAIREFYRRTRMQMGEGATEDEENPLEPKLPSLGEIERITLTVPAEEVNESRPKLMLDCALWEIEMVEEDYAKRADHMLRHREFCRVLARKMHARDFAPTDKVRKLYGVA